MAYNPVEWNTGDVITAAKLNNMDNGIVANENAINDTNDSVTDLRTYFDETIGASMGRKSFTYTYTANANAEIAITGSDLGIPGSVAGFTPVAICAYNTGNANVFARSMAAHASAAGAAVRLKNTSASAVSAEFSITVFFIKIQYNINM